MTNITPKLERPHNHIGKEAHCREAWDNNESERNVSKLQHPNPNTLRDAINRKAWMYYRYLMILNQTATSLINIQEDAYDRKA